jgi:uncharacterized lipoprotein YmbA
MKQRILIVLLAGLCACGSSPPVNYYSLSEPAAAMVAKTGNAVVLMGPFDVAQYLKRPNIVVRDTNQRLQLAQFDQWAETPPSAIVPWLTRDVDRQLASGVVVAFPSIGHADAPYRVRGTISQWDSDAAGTAVLVVQWECVTDKGVAVIPLRTSRYTAQATRPNNYSDVVHALNQTLSEFANDMAGALSAAMTH